MQSEQDESAPTTESDVYTTSVCKFVYIIKLYIFIRQIIW